MQTLNPEWTFPNESDTGVYKTPKRFSASFFNNRNLYKLNDKIKKKSDKKRLA